MNTAMAQAGITTATDSVGWGITLLRRLVFMNLGLVALQPISAGFFLSGYRSAVTIHAVIASALQLGTLIQVITALVLWRRRLVPARVAGISISLFLIVLLEVALGHNRLYWLHVPLGVGLVLALRNATQLVGTGPRLE